jgi:hypothetical protein
MGTTSKKYLETHKSVSIPNEVHDWLVKRAGEIQTETGRRIAIGDVLIDVIREIDSIDNPVF